MKISELEIGSFFSKPGGKIIYEYVGKYALRIDELTYLYLRYNYKKEPSNGFYTTKDIEVEYGLPF